MLAHWMRFDAMSSFRFLSSVGFQVVAIRIAKPFAVACVCTFAIAGSPFITRDAIGQDATSKEAKGGVVEIPTVDLNDRGAWQVVVDREKGQYLGHPTTLLLEDGKTILCVYPKGHGKGAIQYKRSVDGGVTWSERLQTPKNWETSLETPTLHRVITKDGKKRIVLFSGLHPVRQAISEDDGLTWTELKPVGAFGGRWFPM